MPEFIPGLGIAAQAAVIVLAFSFLVFVHELGHFLAARLVGVRVDSFYIGIPIYGIGLKREWRGTTYGVGLLPLGGFVKLAGQSDDPREMGTTGDQDELYSKPLWAQALVFVAGVAMNMVFGFFLLVWAYMYGIPFVPPVLGELDPQGAAEVHGLKEGDRVVSIDGAPMESFEDIGAAIAMAGVSDERIISVLRPRPDGEARPMTFKVLAQKSQTMRGNLAYIGADVALSNKIGGLVEGLDFAEAQQKLRVGDRVLSVAGRPIGEYQGRLAYLEVDKMPGNRVRLEVRREGAGNGAAQDLTVEIPLETAGLWDIGARYAIRISGLIPGGAAEAAGLRAEDSIIAAGLAGEEPIRFTHDLKQFADLIGRSVGQPVRVGIARQGEAREVTIAPRRLPGVMDFGAGGDSGLGVILAGPDTGADAAPDGVDLVVGGPGGRAEAAFVVAEVVAEGPGAGLLEPGDVLTALNGTPLDPARPLAPQVDAAAVTDLVFHVRRRRGHDSAAIAPTELPFADLDKLEKVTLRARQDPVNRRPMIGVSHGTAEVVYIEPGSFLDRRAREYGGSETSLLGALVRGMYFSPDLKITRLYVVPPEPAAVGTAPTRGILLRTPDWVVADPIGAGLRHRLPLLFQPARETNPRPFVPALAMAGEKWVDFSLMVYRTVGKLLTRDIPLEAMGGPVQLFRIIKVADERGFGYLLYVVAMISINLGVCNLLPFPVLDGGHLMFLLYEALFRHKPSERFLLLAQYAGLACLLAVMLTVTGYDLRDLFSWQG